MSLQLWDELEEEFTLIGIRSRDMSESRFIFNLNKYFNFKFYRIEDLDIYIDQQPYCFSLYVHENQKDENEFYLIQNHSHKQEIQSSNGLLFDTFASSKVILNKYKVFDYLLKLPYGKDEIKANPLPLANISFIQKIDVIDDLTTKEKKLLFI